MLRSFRRHRWPDSRVEEVRAAALFGGDCLDEPTRHRLERCFHADLSRIRVHTDAAADHLTRSLNTDAFATGPHLFFGAGAYRPHTEAGLRLLSHEVAHTLQQACRASSTRRSVQDQELEADLAAASVANGQRVHIRGRPARVTDALTNSVVIIQRHESFEHRILGDVAVDDILSLANRASNANEIIERETQLMRLWQVNPEQVSEADLRNLCPGIRTVRLPVPAVAENLLATYGELTALADYLPTLNALYGCPRNVLMSILQTIRAQSYYRLNALRSKDTNDEFEYAMIGPHNYPIGLVDKLLYSEGLDILTEKLGRYGTDRYTAQLARNACHFAPHAWYRWQVAHQAARSTALQTQDRWMAQDQKDRLTSVAWVDNAYAEHFLHDSFAAGHLINKTQVMQCFVQWAATTTDLFTQNWDTLKHFSPEEQPGLAGWPLYDTSYTGAATDPQTVDELPTAIGGGSGDIHYPERVALSQVQAYRVNDQIVDQNTAYQNYWMFLSNTLVQTAANAAHDVLNGRSVWASSETDTIYQLFGDDTLLQSAWSAQAARITAETARTSRQAIQDILDTGTTQIAPEAVRQRFPTRVGDYSNALVSLEEWARSRCQWAIDVFRASKFLDKREAAQASPVIRNLSQDYHETAIQEQKALDEIVAESGDDDMPYLGEIRLFPYEFVPVDWVVCDGSVLQIEQHKALFSLLGAAYGGDGQSNFALPNLAVPFEAGQNQGHYCIAVRGVYPPRS
jgi:Domain of unknown function (DUF4157)/Phage Tail Collar Domain